MSAHDDSSDRITPAQVEVIDRRLGQGFAFLRDVLDRPSILTEIPTGATLCFRDVTIGAGCLRLTAYRTPAMTHWGARVTDDTGDSAAAQARAVETTGSSAAAALDALEAELRRAAAAGALPH